MFQAPDYAHNISLRLSEVLRDIGIDESVVLKRRRMELLSESISTMSCSLMGLNRSAYRFGSRSEGTTTPGLESDTDVLIRLCEFNVIQDEHDWEPDIVNLLMVQESVTPGYCLLERLNVNSLFLEDAASTAYYKDGKGRTLLKNTMAMDAVGKDADRHGPAFTIKNELGRSHLDSVYALSCKTWPVQARPWLLRQGIGQWPSFKMRQFCSTTGCFLVPVGSKGSINEELEWRISTSLAERHLMNSLNITQLQCYVLLKMHLKTFFKHKFDDVISSFICKTVLFHCIENTQTSAWREYNLLGCLSLCLFVLFCCISNENCPHFMIPENNLMKGRLSAKDKQQILKIMESIIASKGQALLLIKCDNLGMCLQMKCCGFQSRYQEVLQFSCEDVSGTLVRQVAEMILASATYSQSEMTCSSYHSVTMTLGKYISKLRNYCANKKGLAKRACCLLFPLYCTSFGSALASFSIGLSMNVSQHAFDLISEGLNTDVSSGKLKQASIFYCTGDIYLTEICLRIIESNYNRNVTEPICGCYSIEFTELRKGFYKKMY